MRVEIPLFDDHRPGDVQELAGSSDEGEFLGFAPAEQALIEGPDRGIEADRRDGSHVERQWPNQP